LPARPAGSRVLSKPATATATALHRCPPSLLGRRQICAGRYPLLPDRRQSFLAM
uniref:Uncharacterized protein n=1 Tax=Aegilops tauschii subsp. strangulata TaxID=200361 RepID=A0A453P2L4_AEGTS